MVRSKKLFAFAATGALVLAACGSDDDSSSDHHRCRTTETSEAVDEAETETSEAVDDETATTEVMDDETATTEVMDDETDAGGAVFAVDASTCDDPDAATAPIEGTITIGTSIPLSGGPAVLFAPVRRRSAGVHRLLQRRIRWRQRPGARTRRQGRPVHGRPDGRQRRRADLRRRGRPAVGDHRLAEQPGDPGGHERPLRAAAQRVDRCAELGQRRRAPVDDGPAGAVRDRIAAVGRAGWLR